MEGWASLAAQWKTPHFQCRDAGGVGLIPGDGTNKRLSGKESTCQCRRCKRHRINSWVGNTPWRRKWQPTRAFLPGNFHGQRSLAGYSPWSCKEWNMTVHAHTVQGTKILHAARCSQKKIFFSFVSLSSFLDHTIPANLFPPLFLYFNFA